MNIALPESGRPYVLIESAAADTPLASLDPQKIRELYIEHGALLLRNYALEMSAFKEFTDQFCQSYVLNESQGRDIVSDDGRLQTVNLGVQHFPLHPEISREPWQPDIAWFGCEQPARVGGETTLCDGVAVAAALPAELKTHLANTTLAHTRTTSLNWCREFYGRDDLQIADLADLSNPKVFVFNHHQGELYRTYLRPMLHKPMFSEAPAYGNFLVFARRRLNTKTYPCYMNGRQIPDQLVDQLESISNRFAVSIDWHKNDLLMVDNTRFMHGRNPVKEAGGRRIITQFGYLSFVPEDYPDLQLQHWRAS